MPAAVSELLVTAFLERVQLVQAFLLLVGAGGLGALIGFDLGILLVFLARSRSTGLHLGIATLGALHIIYLRLAFRGLLDWRQWGGVGWAHCYGRGRRTGYTVHAGRGRSVPWRRGDPRIVGG